MSPMTAAEALAVLREQVCFFHEDVDGERWCECVMNYPCTGMQAVDVLAAEIERQAMTLHRIGLTIWPDGDAERAALEMRTQAQDAVGIVHQLDDVGDDEDPLADVLAALAEATKGEGQ